MTDDQSQRAPYPGLRAFRREETDLFFGREDCINAMVDRLGATRFLAVLGSSGTGKSSLVRTGLLDALELGLMAKAGSRWRIVDFRPGGAPLKNLARRLLETEAPEGDAEVEQKDVDLLRAYLARGPRAVIEWSRGHLPEGGNLLLLVDQFEELFRYQDYAGREEAEAFVALLLESAREADVPIYVTITMRSEYLGACSLIEGLSDAINTGMFLTPRMTRDNCREAIVGPAAVCDIDIEPALVNRLLNDLVNFAPWDEHDASDQLDRLMRRADQLPLLQYTLNRMWQRARERSGDERVNLTIEDYEAIGGLSGALNAHADQIFDRLGKQRAQVAEWVFRALTTGSTIADAVRRPTRLDDLVSACGGDEASVRAVVDAFHAPGVNFLVPEYDPNHPQLAPDAYIDISHESLIRQWKKLSDWLEAEARAAQQWRRLVDRYSTGEMLRGRELANLVAWRQETKPNAAWAKRYGGDYPTVIGYLNKSHRAQNNKRLAMVGGTIGAFVVVTAFGVDATLQRNTVTNQRNELAKQSVALEEQRNELQVRLKEILEERRRAEVNKRQVMELLENVIFNIAVPLTSSDRSSVTSVARRASESAQPGARGGSATSQGEDETQPEESTDRTTTETLESRASPALTTASTAVETTRRLAERNPDDIEIKRLFAVSLNVFGDVKLSANDLNGAEQAYQEGLTMIRAMLREKPDMVLWRDDLALALVGVARVKIRREQHSEARPLLVEAVDIERQLAIGRPPDRLLHNLQVHLGYLGDALVRLNERADARKVFEERLRIRRRRLAALPNDPQRQSDVSIALDRIGQLIRDEGNLDESRRLFEEALKIDRGLFQRDPARRDWQENLVFSLVRLGDLDRQQSVYADAMKRYEEALPLQRRLAASSTAAGPQQTLASLLQKVGDNSRRVKQFPSAIAAHREEVDIRRKLLAREPNNLTAQRNVSIALDYLGNAMQEGADIQGARTAFNEQLDIDRGIAKRNPGDVKSLEDVAWSLNRLGDLDRQVGQFADAGRHFEEALAIQRKLIARDADNPVRVRALAQILGKLGGVRSSLKDHASALELHKIEIDLRRQLYQRSPKDSGAVRDLSLATDRAGNVLRDMGDFKGALEYYLEELALDRSFLASQPTNVLALSDVQWTLNKIQDFFRTSLKDNLNARRYLQDLIEIDRRMLERTPPSKDRHQRLRDDLQKLADMQVAMHEPAAARDVYGEMFVVDQRWLAIANENLKTSQTDANRNDVAQAYSDAGWHALLAGRAKDALAYIEAALAARPDTPWNLVNLGHAYLFLGQYAEAIQIYDKVKHLSRTADGKRTYADEIRDDFAMLRRLELALPEMDRALRELNL